MIGFKNEGMFDKTKKFLQNAQNMRDVYNRAGLEAIAETGVTALENATPKRSGKTASSWSYEIEQQNGKTIVSWTNDNVVNGVNIAIIIQHGHGTRGGSYVAGIDYINPALRPIFTKMSDDMWKAVVSL